MPRAYALALLLLPVSDWPQLLGPDRNGIYSGADVAPNAALVRIWERKIGQGFSAPVVSEGRLILFHRLGDQETVEALDATTP